MNEASEITADRVCTYMSGPQCECCNEVHAVRTENVRLAAWKAEALDVLRAWDRLADEVIGRMDWHDTLGFKRPEIVNNEMERLLEMVCIVANETNCAPDRLYPDRVVVSLHRDDYNLICSAAGA